MILCVEENNIELGDIMIGDYEYLYMIRQNDRSAMDRVHQNFNCLMWKRAHDHFSIQKPQGIGVEDLYQEGYIGFYESLFSYQESRGVGFAFYVNLCVVSSVKTALRKCRGQSYRLLDSRYSLDMSIAEDDSIFLSDLVESRDVRSNPQLMANYYEAQVYLRGVLSKMTLVEQRVFELREEGYGYQEIADKLGITPKKVDNIVQKLRRVVIREA